MVPVSVVIITKNESANIAACIQSAQLITNDVIVVDCGSTDDTAQLATQAGAKLLRVEWQCYGQSRNTGALAAKHDWILALDADERITASLATALRKLDFSNEFYVYRLRRENYYENKKIRFGTLGFERISRLYNRRQNQWDLVPVHEKLESRKSIRRNINHSILHYGIPGKTEHVAKKEQYALLSAYKYQQQGKKATLVKRYVSPLFDGCKSYVFQLGFLDGRTGWQLAKTIVYYTWLKYHYLHQLTPETEKQIVDTYAINRPYQERTASPFSLKR